jgi:hypothetical protein
VRFDTELAVRRFFREHGYRVHSIRRTGHWQVKASRPGGPTTHWTIAHDYWGRNEHNLEADLRHGRQRWSARP